MSINFHMEYDDVDRLQKAIINFGEKAEKTINDYLKGEGKEKFIDGVENIIPVSDRNKSHAKMSNPLQGVQEENMTITIKNKKPYQYLYFPDTGGFVTNPVGQNFMEKGMESKVDSVVNDILDRLQTNLNNF